MKEYQTIIIGAGPAGLIAGRNLKDFLILDKKSQIGEPVQCGEGISAGALKKQQIEPNDSWVNCRIHRVKRIMPNGKCMGRRHKEPLGYVIDRIAFEKSLAEPIKDRIKLGCEAEKLEFVGDHWQVFTRNKESFKSKYLIGADGVNSIVRRVVFPENQAKTTFYPAIEYLAETEKELDTSELEIFFDNEKYVEGYAWVFPKSKNKANIGIGGRAIKMSYFHEFLEKIVKARYGKCSLLENKSGVVPITEPVAPVFKNNAFLVGDAAGLADPFIKGGMNQGMVSAKIAAECILNNQASEYTSKLEDAGVLNKKVHKASKIFHSFSNEALNDLGDVLENRSTAYLKTFSGIRALLSKPGLRGDAIRLFIFLRAWWENRDNLW